MNSTPINLPARRIALLGSTGSIGQSALEVVEASKGEIQVDLLAACRSTTLLLEQTRRFRPRYVVVTDLKAAEKQNWSDLPPECKLLVGPDAIAQSVVDPEIDTVVSAIVGSVGLRGTWAALEAGKKIALANKESLVVAGPLVMQLAKEKGTTILPVDSEHSAVFQALQAGGHNEVRRLILTASGGPFRKRTCEQLAEVTVEDALAHPTWSMGKKITIDSATLMNKALEIIEARWLFDIEPERIEVVLHPQSLIHSMVEYCDGSVIAQMSVPDMKLPIQYALTWPKRRQGVAQKMDWTKMHELHFEPPDLERFGALRLGLEAAKAGGTAGAALNGANEAAVEAFLEGRLSFDRIVPACEQIIKNHNFDPRPTLDDVIHMDRWAYEEVRRCLK